MSYNKTIDNVHVEIYGHEMLSELITRARKNNIPYDKEMKYDFHSHGHSYLVLKDGELTLLEDPSEKHGEEISLNGFFEIYLSKEEVNSQLEVGKWYKTPQGGLYHVVSIEDRFYNTYGFSVAGYWFVNKGIPKGCVSYDREATHQEVELALIEEAKIRGYKEGVVCKFGSVNDKRVIRTSEYTYEPWKDTMAICMGMNVIFDEKSGQWATIIEQDKFAELKEAHRNGAVIELWSEVLNKWLVVKYNSDLWLPNYEYRIKPEEALEIGDKVIGIRTDCAIVGEVSSVSKKKVCVNNLVFLKDQVHRIDNDKFEKLKAKIKSADN